jgi:hypothetical protein
MSRRLDGDLSPGAPLLPEPEQHARTRQPEAVA